MARDFFARGRLIFAGILKSGISKKSGKDRRKKVCQAALWRLSNRSNISINSVNRIIRQKKRTCLCELKTHNSGRKPILTESDLKNISELIDEQPDITINEIIEKLNLKTVNETVRKAVIKMGYVYKKKSLHASERERPRCNWKKRSLG